MTSSKRKSSIRQKVANYRERMRAQRLRPVQLWVPDTRTAEFRAEAHCQSLAAAQSPTEKEDQAFIDSISVWDDESFLKE